MKYTSRFFIITFCLNIFINCGLTEFFTVSAIGGALISGYLGWNTIKSNTICRFAECCNVDYVPYDIDKFNVILSQKIFGQPLVKELVNILLAHKEAIYDENKQNRKALVISFHGWSGVGKNYAASLLAEAIYKRGMQSKFVKVIMGKKDFDCSDMEKSKRKLISEVQNIVKACPMSLIIFDEIHDMCPHVLDAIKPMLDHHHEVDGINFRDSIFIFISNIGGQEIASSLLGLYSEGLKRNEVEFHHFEPIIRRTAYYTGGFEKSSTVAQHLIDYYIPFLPLEQRHVQMCALAEFNTLGVVNVTEEMMVDALSVITYGPTEDQPIFANNGCKRFTKHIPYVIQKYKRKDEL